MKKLIRSLVFGAAFLLSETSVAISIGDARKMHAAGAEAQSQLMFYLDSQQNGLGWANLHLELEERARFYCQPPKLALTGENIWRLTNTYIEKNTTNNPEAPFDMFVLDALIEAFPCESQTD